MRMMFPGLRERRTIDRQLTTFFRDYQEGEFRRAIGSLSRFYDLPCPRVSWFEYLDWGKTAGRTYENGVIHLVHPENWKRGRKYNSERQWVHTVYHEFGHYVLWADPERKADVGLNQTGLYELRGVITHQGASADSGHYTAYVKKSAVSDPKAKGKKKSAAVEEDNKWWWFNDDKVSEVTAEKIEALAGGGESHSALILLYQAVPLPEIEEETATTTK